MELTQVQPPVVKPTPWEWIRKNLFSTWFNILITILLLWVMVLFLRSALDWATTEARWGVIKANLTLFMIGQYPRDQLWRIWLSIYLLMGLIGLSWGLWKRAARDFGLIALGAAIVFAVIAVLIGSQVWLTWLLAGVIVLAAYRAGLRIPRSSQVAGIGWLLYFPLILLLISGSRAIPGLPAVRLSLWGGLLLTLMFTVVGNIGALPLGVLLALGRRSKLPIVKYFCVGYIELIRGVPLITILYMADNLLPLFLPGNVRPDRVLRAMVGLILFEAAYQAENVRGGLQAVPRGQYEAAHALGLSGALTTTLIILPQAIRAVIPALFNSFISLFKDTSLVSIIGLFDLLLIGNAVIAQSEWLGTHREVYIFAFVVYWGFSLAFSHGSRRIEEAMGVGRR